MPQDDSRRTAWVIAISSVLRLLVAAVLPLGIDESYAVVIGRNLSLSYFDHPPAVFWLAHAAAFLGGESPLSLRWPFVVLFALTSWLLFRLTSRLFGTRAGFWAVCAAQSIPVFSLSGGSWVLPDGPLLLASTAAALALAHAVSVSAGAEPDGHVAADDTNPNWFAWIGLGISLGLAGLAKYHAALLGLGDLASPEDLAVARAHVDHETPPSGSLRFVASLARGGPRTEVCWAIAFSTAPRKNSAKLSQASDERGARPTWSLTWWRARSPTTTREPTRVCCLRSSRLETDGSASPSACV